MTRTYSQLLPYAFRRFSVLTASRTALPTLSHYLTHAPFPPSPKPALFTMNILPPMMTVWHHLTRKNLGDAVDITIFDCSGRLNPKDFPGARMQKFLNFYAATKSDEFLYHIARHRRIAWLCDDDVFFLGGMPLRILEREFADPMTASVSFRPRTWWHFDIDGARYEPSGSYCVAFNREIVIDRERLSMKPADGNMHPADIGRPPGRYDTGDLANERLLHKGYRCCILPEKERNDCITAFSGMSGAVILLHYFHTPDQVLDFFAAPSNERWGGNMLFGLLSSMLAVCTIQECYERLKGRPYPLRSLPSRAALERLRRDKEPFLRDDQSFTWIDDVSEKLRAAL